MRNWHYIPEHPVSLTIAADARLGPTDYVNDQIWQVNLGNSDPPAVALETTFGLRARLCRIFPRFILNGQVVNDPAHFSYPITIQQYYPNYICLSFKPFSSINVRLEYWVPGSQVIAGRTKLTNTSHEACSFELEWAELLLPAVEGSRMALAEIGMISLLTGKTAELSPVFFLTGGAESGKSPYPSLSLAYTLEPGNEQEVQWVHASLDETNASYELAKKVINQNWNAEFARIARINSKVMEIYTGNKDWDTAFYLSQTIAHQLLIGSTQTSGSPSIVTTRKPDQGFSLKKDGSDYNHLWNGQTPIDTYYLANLLLPASPELIKGLLDNFFAAQTERGEIDWKPGLAGQRSHLIATPLLAELTLRYFESTSDTGYLKAVFPRLVAFYSAWFSPDHDRDGDQFPEWDQAVQTGFDDLPLFTQHEPWSLGVDISTVESPDLVSYLFRECIALITIARTIGNAAAVSQFEEFSERLKTLIDQSWDDQHASYLYRDRDSHFSTPVESLGSIHGVGVIDIHRDFLQPVRPNIRIDTQREVTHPAQLFIHGSGSSGAHRVEHIPTNRVRWQLNSGFATSEYAYTSIEKVEINGIRPDDFVEVNTVNLASMDQSLLLPIWAGIPSDDRAKILINLTIMNRKKFLGPFGLRSCIDFPGSGECPESYFGTHYPWTEMILDGMLQYGARKKAAEVFSRMMKPVAQAIQHDLTLYQSYHSDTGKPLGTQNSLSSLVPVGLFLKILGVKIIKPTELEITGHNPFPWPVTVKYQGLTVVKQEKKTLVIFPDGQSVTVDNDQTRTISCE